MKTNNLSPQIQKAIANAPFPYNQPELLFQYRGKNIVVVDDEIVAAGDVDLSLVFKHYREQGKEPVIICVPPDKF